MYNYRRADMIPAQAFGFDFDSAPQGDAPTGTATAGGLLVFDGLGLTRAGTLSAP